MSWKLAAVVLLVGWQLLLLRGFTNHLDLHPSDGLLYVRNGMQLLRGELRPDMLAWGPVLAVGFAGLHAAGIAAEHLHDVMTVLVAVGSTVALFWLLVAACGTWPALVLAALWAASPVVLNPAAAWPPPPTYLLAATFGWAGTALLLRGRTALAFVLLAAAAVERGEFAFVLSLGALAWLSWSRRGRDRLPASALVVVAGALFALHQVHGSSRVRSWLAFRQHYAGVMSDRRGLETPYDGPATEQLIANDFPGATSPLSAVARNPRAALGHAFHNLGTLPEGLAPLCVEPFSYRPPWRWTCLALSGIAVAVALSRRFARFRRLLARRGLLLTALAAGAVGSFAVALLLAPRAVLLWPVLPLGLVPLGLALRTLVQRPRIATPIALVAVVVLAAVAPRPFGSGADGLREVRAAMHLLQRQRFAPGDRVCAEYGKLLCAVAGVDRAVQVVEWSQLAGSGATPADCAAAFAAAAPNVLIVSAATFAAAGPLAVAMVQELASDRWDIVDYWFPALVYRRAP